MTGELSSGGAQQQEQVDEVKVERQRPDNHQAAHPLFALQFFRDLLQTIRIPYRQPGKEQDAGEIHHMIQAWREGKNRTKIHPNNQPNKASIKNLPIPLISPLMKNPTMLPKKNIPAVTQKV